MSNAEWSKPSPRHTGLWKVDADHSVAISVKDIKYVRRTQDGSCRVLLARELVVDVKCSSQEYADLLDQWNKAVAK